MLKNDNFIILSEILLQISDSKNITTITEEVWVCLSHLSQTSILKRVAFTNRIFC